MVSSVDRKLIRDLGLLRGQVITIALVVASGIASYVSLQGTFTSLKYSQDAYYAHYRFGDAFVHLKRAPESLRHRLESIEGVARAHTRIVEGVMVPVDTLPEPAHGTIVSLEGAGNEPLNALHLAAGRFVEPGRADEALLLQSFALEHNLTPGDRLPVVINGTMRRLRIVGIVMSPEYVFPLPVGGISADPKRFAGIWMDRDVLAPAFEMAGAFNDVTFRLQPGANETAILSEVDRILEPYGGFGMVTRAKQPSNYILEGEMSQLEAWATVVPFIFLGVAAFLLNVVLSRLVLLQRTQIAALKAVGYTDRQIGFHYVKLVSAIVLIGAILGIAAGAYLGSGLLDVYKEYFRFPELVYRLDIQVAFIGIAVSLVAAVTGALGAARRVARMPPAEAMRPPAPVSYTKSLLEKMGFHKLLSPSARMVLREIERRPLRTILSSLGIGMAIGILVVGRFQADAIEWLVETQFHHAWREDVSVQFIKPLPERARREMAHLAGVQYAEGQRMVPVRFHVGHRHRDSVIAAYEDGGHLRKVLDMRGLEVELPDGGVVISRKLAEILEVSPGDSVEVEIREGERGRKPIRVAGTIEDTFGLFGYMSIGALRRFLGEGEVISGALLEVDPPMYESLQRRLKDMPLVASVISMDMIVSQFDEQSGEWMLVMTMIMTILASTIAVGVVYNNARVSLSMRSRDLASLRVLGFTRAEISAILLGELAVQLLLAIPIGLWVGTKLAEAIMETVDPEQYRFPVVISTQTYVFAVVVALASGLVSALLVRRKLDRLDLIGVLKTRE